MRPAQGRGTDGDNENIVSPFFLCRKNPPSQPVSRRGEGVIGPGAQGEERKEVVPSVIRLTEGRRPTLLLSGPARERGREGQREREGGAERE